MREAIRVIKLLIELIEEIEPEVPSAVLRMRIRNAVATARLWIDREDPDALRHR